MNENAFQTPQSFDIISALRLALRLFWRDFAPIIILGMIFLTLPAVASKLYIAGPGETTHALGTVVSTVRGLLIMIFICAVSGGILAQRSGQVLSASDFVKIGLAVMQPGLVTALSIGVAIMVLRIVFMLIGGVIVPPGLSSWLFVIGCIGLFSVWAAAIPAALDQRLPPLGALRQSATLTAGNRLKLSGLFISVILATLPALLLIRSVVFGGATTPLEIADILNSMTLASPGLWIGQLTNLLIMGVFSTIPVALYLVLTAPRQT